MGINGTCDCEGKYTDDDCGRVGCPKDKLNNSECAGHGECSKEGACTCEDGWEGDDCSEKVCLNQCSGNGYCAAGICSRKPKFMGADCSITRIEHHVCEEKCTKKCLAACKDTASISCFTDCNTPCMEKCSAGIAPEKQ